MISTTIPVNRNESITDIAAIVYFIGQYILKIVLVCYMVIDITLFLIGLFIITRAKFKITLSHLVSISLKVSKEKYFTDGWSTQCLLLLV